MYFIFIYLNVYFHILRLGIRLILECLTHCSQTASDWLKDTHSLAVTYIYYGYKINILHSLYHLTTQHTHGVGKSCHCGHNDNRPPGGLRFHDSVIHVTVSLVLG